jgi:hypothetical protein
LLVAKQYFRLSPRSSFEPGGSLLLIQRLWKERLVGWRKRGDFFVESASLKLLCIGRFGLETNP